MALHFLYVTSNLWNVCSGQKNKVSSLNSKVENLLRNNLVNWGQFFSAYRLCTVPLRLYWYCVFDSESSLKEQFEKEKAALQQSIHKNSAFISEKEQQVEKLMSEVRILTLLLSAGIAAYWPNCWACTKWIQEIQDLRACKDRFVSVHRDFFFFGCWPTAIENRL